MNVVSNIEIHKIFCTAGMFVEYVISKTNKIGNKKKIIIFESGIVKEILVYKYGLT